ncbi:MAG: bifunctional hydroxymethylpyrimidine kinase/phosphomethylpyrimidine kinase [Candidatus Jordarchaeum sp.]|uniref:bifunctional hydroxymethylpyrimidine kinase/phosphomethylpyrimidine kinase n=1 Tax=Candidatus Jordarchaeum sp. TaxID=2823881 RepID=UPI00404913E8
MKVPVALTIAGSDSSGGAGIQADLKTFAALGVHGTCAITAITAQNTLYVRDIISIPPEMVMAQIDVITDDIEVDATKTGMLYEPEIIELVCNEHNEHGFPLVVDPVIWAGSGDRLVTPAAEKKIIKSLIPISLVVTPNVTEAAVIADTMINSVHEMEEAARAISTLGPEVVVIKGGHLEATGDTVVDVMVHAGEITQFKKSRVEEPGTHGSGCSFSSAIAAYIAKGYEPIEAVSHAEKFIEVAVGNPIMIGGGRKPVNPIFWLEIDAERWRVLKDLDEAVKRIETADYFGEFIPEVRTNIGMAIPTAKSVDDVAAVDGRIMNHHGQAKPLGAIRFGTSSHIARTILTIMEHDPSIRAAINIKYSEEIIKACMELDLIVSTFDRTEEPEEVKKQEGRSLPWGINRAITSIGKVPDIIFDRGGIGKEAMIRIFAHTAKEAVEKTIRIIQKTKKK